MGLRYAPGRKLDWHLRGVADLARLRDRRPMRSRSWHSRARRSSALRPRLGRERALIGFVGGPFTLYAYAVAGSHEGFTRQGRRASTMACTPASANASSTCSPTTWCCRRAPAPTAWRCSTPRPARSMPRASRSTRSRRWRAWWRASANPARNTPVIYYSRDTGPDHWRALEALDLQCLGVDWRHDLDATLVAQTPRWCLQGNLDPDWLLLPAGELERRVRAVFSRVRALPAAVRAAWVCGLGHGVLQKTPVSNVRLVLAIQKEMFT